MHIFPPIQVALFSSYGDLSSSKIISAIGIADNILCLITKTARFLLSLQDPTTLLYILPNLHYNKDIIIFH